MNPELHKLLHEERKRVFEPDSNFPVRVMARLNEQSATREAAIWDIVPTAVRPIFAIALMMLLAFLTLEAFVPAVPSQGMIEAFLEPDRSIAVDVLYTESDAPASHDLLEQLIVLEEAE